MGVRPPGPAPGLSPGLDAKLPASTWMLITSPYSLWKETLAQGITRLLTGVLVAPSLQHRGVLDQEQEHPRVVLLPPWMMTL